MSQVAVATVAVVGLLVWKGGALLTLVFGDDREEREREQQRKQEAAVASAAWQERQQAERVREREEWERQAPVREAARRAEEERQRLIRLEWERQAPMREAAQRAAQQEARRQEAVRRAEQEAALRREREEQQRLRALEQWRSSLPPPFPGASGEWVLREDFPGTKSFGRFKCTKCGKKWTSAHAFKDFAQGCQSCETKSLPVCLWLNDDSVPHGDSSSDESDDDEPDLPHDRGRCDACKAGRCLSNNNGVVGVSRPGPQYDDDDDYGYY